MQVLCIAETVCCMGGESADKAGGQSAGSVCEPRLEAQRIFFSWGIALAATCLFYSHRP